MSEIDKLKVGQRIKKIRIANGKDLSDFGKLFSVSKSNVSKWENGANLPNKKRLKQIAELGNIGVDYLLYGDPINFLQKCFSLKSDRYDLSGLNSKGEMYLYQQIFTKYNIYVTFNLSEFSTEREQIYDYNELLEFATNNLDLIISELIEKAKRIISSFKNYNFKTLQTISQGNEIYKKYLSNENITTSDIINNYYIFRDFEIEKRITIEDNKSNNIHFIAHVINELLKFNALLSNENRLTEDEKADFENFLGIVKNSYPTDYTFKNTLLESSELSDYININILKDIDTLIEKYSQITD